MRATEISWILSFADILSLRHNLGIGGLLLTTIVLCPGATAPNMPIYVALLCSHASDIYSGTLEGRRGRSTLSELTAAAYGLLERRTGSRKQLRSRPLRAIAKHLLHFVAHLVGLGVAWSRAAVELRTVWKRFIDEVIRLCSTHDREYLIAGMEPAPKAVLKELLGRDN